MIIIDIYLETMEWISNYITGQQPEPHSFYTCTAVGKRMMVFGGRSPENIHFDDLHICDMWVQNSIKNVDVVSVM